MADDPDHQLHNLQSIECRNTSSDQTDDLTYPQLPLETSFGSLLNISYISNHSLQDDNMRTAPTQRPPPSLSESWASLSDPELSQDDELRSEDTDVGSLADVRSVDDILSVQEDATTIDEEPDDDDALPVYDPSGAQYAPHLEQSEQLPSAGASLTETSLLPTHLTLEEPEDSVGDDIVVRHVLKDFTEAEATSLGLDRAGDHGRLVGTIRTSLSKSSLRDSGRQSLHLLILGKDYLPSLRTSIMGKVADALVASSSSFDTSRLDSPSRFHIVPDCFGPGSMPSAAEVIPIDCQLEVDSYQSAEFVDQAHQVIRLRDAVSQKSLQSVRYENGYAIDGEKGGKPDLAVIVVSGDGSSADVEEACVMMIFAQRHSIPVLVISIDNGWGAESLPFGDTTSSAHRCIEYMTIGENGPCRRLPLDIDTLLELDPAQLSRHLAHIVQRPQERQAKRGIQASSLKPSTTYEDSGMKWPNFAKSLPSMQRMKTVWSRVPPWFLAALGAILLLQVCVMLFLQESNMRRASLSHRVAVNSHTEAIPLTMMTQTSKTTAAVETGPTIQSLPLTIDATKSIGGSFEVEVVGNSHLVIRTPSNPKKKKKDSLIFSVSKDGQLVDVKATLLFPHVYSVYVPREKMYGNLTIRLEMVDPRSVDTVTINLGQQSLNEWLRHALEKAGGKLLEMVDQIQRNVEKNRQNREQQGIDQGVQSLRAAVLKVTRQGEQLTRPLRNRIAQLESRIQAWNECVDARGAEMLSSAKAIGADLFIRGMEQVKQMKQTSRCFPKIPLRRLPNPLAILHDAVTKLKVGQRLQQASTCLHDSAQSETLKTAQDRAQHIVKFWRRSEGEARRRHLG